MNYQVTVTMRELTTIDLQFTFETEGEVRAFMREEVKWENTVKVSCPILQLEQLGDFECMRANDAAALASPMLRP